MLPWKLRRIVLNKIFGYDIDATAYIGWAWIFPGKLVMKKGAKIGHFTTALHLDFLAMGENSSIGRSNWITGFPSRTKSPHFRHQPDRTSQLILGDESAITKHHHLDCTNRINIGKFVTIAGYYSQFLTHSIDVIQGRQDSKSIEIGDYSFVGTNVVILGGAKLPPRSILGAKSLLNKPFNEELKLYGGVPAEAIKAIPADAAYFNRETGFIF